MKTCKRDASEGEKKTRKKFNNGDASSGVVVLYSFFLLLTFVASFVKSEFKGH